MLQRIKDWYEGEFEVYENDPNSQVVIIGGDYKRHWTARIARVVVEFYLDHWKWLWAFSMSVVGLYLAWLKL